MSESLFILSQFVNNKLRLWKQNLRQDMSTKYTFPYEFDPKLFTNTQIRYNLLYLAHLSQSVSNLLLNFCLHPQIQIFEIEFGINSIHSCNRQLMDGSQQQVRVTI